ncbi:MAG TPA: LytTR family DNA-binding domain-containing protein, partial [Flavihumibacter sp.]
DEQLARLHLQQLIEELDCQIQVVKTLDSVASTVDFLEKEQAVDLLFVDIELGDGDSFEIFEQLDVNIPVIFTTAYEQHAIKAFKQLSVDYLLKPITKEELWEALMKYKKHYREPAPLLDMISCSLLNRNGQYKSRFLARLGARMVSVPMESVAYFYTRDRVQYIKTMKGQDYMIDRPLDEIENNLDPSRFFRANRQFILNYYSIRKTQAWLNGKLKVCVEPTPYEEIVISRLRAADFRKWLGE